MPQAQIPFYALNAGEVDPDALARIDLEKLRVAGEEMVNFTPTVLGGMHMRPGTRFVDATRSNAKAVLVPYVYNASTTSLIEITNGSIRVFNDDAEVRYPSYDTDITNQYFNNALGSGWTNVSTTGASASISGGKLLLDSTNYSYARARQQVSVKSGDRAQLHCAKVVVARGPVVFRVGTSAGNDDVVADQTLDTGTHFIAFEPGNNDIWLEFEANEETQGTRQIEECTFVKNAVMNLPGPWSTEDLPYIRHAQSGSIVFVACRGKKQYKIERRGPNSWGIAEYNTTGGPYVPSSKRKVRLKVSGSVGNVTLQSDQSFFKRSMIGAVFEITTPGQRRTEVFTGGDQSTQPIKVTGVGGKDGTARRWTYTLTYPSGSSGTVNVEWSYGTPDAWSKVHGEQVRASANAPGTYVVNDAVLRAVNNNKDIVETNDNAIVYFRLRSASGATGRIGALMEYAGGAQVGIVRVTGYNSRTSVDVEVIKEVGSVNTFTDDWREGAWSGNQSWPTAVGFHDGRLFWGGLDKVYGSVSDDYYNYDPTTVGDAGPIIRSIATGPVESIGWLLPLQRLMVGTASAEVSIRSSSFDEPLTPTQFTARSASTVGSAPIAAVAVDAAGVYVQKNLSKIYELIYDVNANDYSSRDLTRLNKNICKPGVVDIAVQRQPDTRVWFVKSDGTMAMLVYERSDEVIGWARFVMDGFVENVCVLPSANDDIVYVVVRRTIDGQTKRYIERLSPSSQTEDGNGAWLVDSAVRYATPTATRIIPNLGHLVGKQVVAKGGSDDPTKLYTVSASGQIRIDNLVTSIVVGLPYEARFKSVKLAYGSANATALGQKKRVDHLGVVANNTAPDGVRVGRDFTSMTKLSSLVRGKPMTDGQIIDHYDYDATSFGGAWDSDSRVCIKCVSPYPAHILGLVVKMNTNDSVFAYRKQPSENGT